jgi:hypothetical protein
MNPARWYQISDPPSQISGLPIAGLGTISGISRLHGEMQKGRPTAKASLPDIPASTARGNGGTCQGCGRRARLRHGLTGGTLILALAGIIRIIESNVKGAGQLDIRTWARALPAAPIKPPSRGPLRSRSREQTRGPDANDEAFLHAFAQQRAANL